MLTYQFTKECKLEGTELKDQPIKLHLKPTTLHVAFVVVCVDAFGYEALDTSL